jgi:hypothetical protein
LSLRKGIGREETLVVTQCLTIHGTIMCIEVSPVALAMPFYENLW